MPNKGPTADAIDLRTLLPDTWNPLEGDAFISAYQMIGVSLADLSPPITTELADVCVVMGWFSLPHLRVEREIPPRHDGQVIVPITAGTGELRANAPVALFVRRAEQTAASIKDANEDIQAAVALVSGFGSLTLVYEHVEDYWFDLAAGQIKPASALILDPLWIYDASLDAQARRGWSAGADAIAQHADSQRIRLSLRWFEEAKRVRDKSDAFVRLWIAIEVLIMPNETNIRPVRDALANIYAIPVEDVSARFGLGRLYGLRGDIVHDGFRVDETKALPVLLGAIYLDLLLYRLGGVPPKRADAIISQSGGLANILP